MEKKVKLQKQKAYAYQGHFIYKYRLNIPSDMVRDLGWDDKNTELSIRTKDKKLEIAKAG